MIYTLKFPVHVSIRGCVLPSVRLSIRPLVRNAFVSAGRDEPTNDLFRVYELVLLLLRYFGAEAASPVANLS